MTKQKIVLPINSSILFRCAVKTTIECILKLPNSQIVLDMVLHQECCSLFAYFLDVDKALAIAMYPLFLYSLSLCKPNIARPCISSISSYSISAMKTKFLLKTCLQDHRSIISIFISKINQNNALSTILQKT